MFEPFTIDEIESIRSIVLLGQQQDDMLLSNCSTRPLVQTRSFIRRFKKVLLDTQAAVSEITNSANEQYVAIIAGVRVKRTSRGQQSHHMMTSATSVANLASPLFQSVESVPYKFRSKYARIDSTEADNTSTSLPPPLPTRSRSVSEGLSLPDPSPPPSPLPTTQTNPPPAPIIQQPQQQQPQQQKTSNLSNLQQLHQKTSIVNSGKVNLTCQVNQVHESLPVLPPLQKSFPRACKSASELQPGTLAALLSNNGGPAIICRVLGSRPINGIIHLLVSFFQRDLQPTYVQPQHLVILPPYPRQNRLILPDPITVDGLLERMMQTAQVIIMDNDLQPQSSDPQTIQQHRDLMFRTLACAAHLIFLDFAANYIVPRDKLKMILDSIGLMNPVKYNSSKIYNNKCRDLIYQILSYLS